MWQAQVELLRGARRVVVYDLRAHGRSPAATEPYSAVDDLHVLMDELAVRRADLIGLSNGARVALDFALTHPGRVRSLVLAAPGVSVYVNRAALPWLVPVLNAARSGDVLRAAELWAATPLMRIAGDSLAAVRVLHMSRDNRSLWGYAANPERPLSAPALERLHEINVPVLVVAGEHDLPELRQLAETVAGRIPGARLRVITGAGHLVNLAAPAEFNATIAAFLIEQAGR
jgi:pimeloyl-ACP methyl ester carboxylesterase